MRRIFSTVLLAQLFLVHSTSLSAADTVPTADSPKAVPPGSTALLKTPEKGMRYFLRVPAGYSPKRGARLIVFLHGSNMNGLAYLRTFEAKKWGEGDIIACPNGETGDAPYGANNFTFDSAPYVAEVTREVQSAFRVTHSFLGGHSQGGFLTYSVILNYPELFQGAFPMAGDCWSQNEPNLWEDRPELLAKQRAIAIAVIHGREDPVVQFSQGEHAYGIFRAMAYPRLRFFAPEKLGHQFGLAPVDEALEWLDAMVGIDPTHTAERAVTHARAEEWGWATVAAKHVADAKRAPSGARKTAKNILAAAEKKAKAAASELEKAMAESPAEKWIPRWQDFQQDFGQTEAAAPLVARFEKMRAEQRATGRRLFGEARALFRSEKQDEGRAKLRELLEKAPASYEAYYALAWLD